MREVYRTLKIKKKKVKPRMAVTPSHLVNRRQSEKENLKQKMTFCYDEKTPVGAVALKRHMEVNPMELGTQLLIAVTKLAISSIFSGDGTASKPSTEGTVGDWRKHE